MYTSHESLEYGPVNFPGCNRSYFLACLRSLGTILCASFCVTKTITTYFFHSEGVVSARWHSCTDQIYRVILKT